MTPFSTEHIDDYEDLIAVLNKYQVEYIIIGAYAVGHYGYLRATEDMDLLVSPKPENAKKVVAALKDFAGVKVDPAEIKEKTMIELGVKPNALHIMTNITGVAWEKAWASREQSVFGDQPAPFLSKECLIENKRATARGKDSIDLVGLGVEPLKAEAVKPIKKKRHG